MISRTSIDEANRHLLALHKRVAELEHTVKDQHEALVAKDDFLKAKLNEVVAGKDQELKRLTEKLTTAEKTVDIIQEQLRQKHQQVASLQRSCRQLQNVVLFKSSLKNLVKTIETAEHDLSSQADLLHVSTVYTQRDRHHDMSINSKSDSGIVGSIMTNHMGSSISDEMLDSVNSSPSSFSGRKPRRERRTRGGSERSPKGHELYL
ncbi:vimentin-type intermediate filament-associated coiled-coil protein-like [Gigantopelta aegis]|uniref:vimentin-type intermediate filament-associated coiled-coil protein-like n=1 Tax=Gigantopelta aegis TaxID=1735272 RepID=UPI001B88C40C|nr:vimentin-type intermediate filament-associated coiled-coil protein-like [Gigantopelta aegis]